MNMALESQLSRAGYAYDDLLPDEDTEAEAAYRAAERITDDPDELEEALAEDGVARDLARVVTALYMAHADRPELRVRLIAAVEAIVDGVVKRRRSDSINY